ncbi:hypothetical protein [Tenacibaculum sp. L6]|uniref:hypothetical protein n=1 Tax=Tenacibaculum sp. L6 TaxID=2992764 RepID=UPI00237C508D|nr:hypothetical protein [Tenacibaculum sp. L6]MDE0536098.1 hypothetical protein [Tenacibaculum sp. L6]
MKRTLFILLFFFIQVSIAQEGVWIYKKYEIINKTKSSHHHVLGLTINFEKQNIRPVYTDTIINFTIDKTNKKISTHNSDSWVKYEVYNNDSIIVNDVESNVLRYFYPLKLDKKIKKSRREIIDLLSKNKFNNVKDTINLKFLNQLSHNTIGKFGFETNYFNDSDLGGWFLREFKGNFFLGLSFAPYVSDYNIYQIIKINSKKIFLNKLLKVNLI